MFPATLATLAALAALLVGSLLQGDPNDPMTWAKKLKNLRDQKEALDHLANMDVERARAAVPALIELYKDTKQPEHLEALARYKDPQHRSPCSSRRSTTPTTTSTAPSSPPACSAR